MSLIDRETLQKAFEAECVGECGCCKHIKHDPEGCALIDDAPEVKAVPRDEHAALHNRYTHLLKSEFIRSFAQHDPKTHTYARDIAEADGTVKRISEAYNRVVGCNMELLERLKRVERERDAAIDDVFESLCAMCKNFNPTVPNERRGGCKISAPRPDFTRAIVCGGFEWKDMKSDNVDAFEGEER